MHDSNKRQITEASAAVRKLKDRLTCILADEQESRSTNEYDRRAVVSSLEDAIAKLTEAQQKLDNAARLAKHKVSFWDFMFQNNPYAK